jgi:hypothetical protein
MNQNLSLKEEMFISELEYEYLTNEVPTGLRPVVIKLHQINQNYNSINFLNLSLKELVLFHIENIIKIPGLAEQFSWKILV